MSKSQWRRKLEKLERDELDAFFKELDSESDRAAAIMAGAQLDVWLEALLREFMVSDESAIDSLFVDSGALGAFGMKINLSYALGLISSNELNDLKILKDIRNRFAHELHGLSFKSPPIADRCRRLSLVEQAKYNVTEGHFIDPRRRCLSTCALVSFYLYKRIPDIREEQRYIRDEGDLLEFDGRYFRPNAEQS